MTQRFARIVLAPVLITCPALSKIEAADMPQLEGLDDVDQFATEDRGQLMFT
jgi:hypothetical protein